MRVVTSPPRVCYTNHIDGSPIEGVMKLSLILGTEWENEKNDETIAEVLRVLDRTDSWPSSNAGWVTWAAPLPRDGKPTTTSMTCK